MLESSSPPTYWKTLWLQFKGHRLGYFCFLIIILFCLVGVYAPVLASSKPFVINFDRQWYFPFFNYIFYAGFYTKKLDLFFNLLMFTLPLGLLCARRKRGKLVLAIATIHILMFIYLVARTPEDPAVNPELNQKRQLMIVSNQKPNTWQFELDYMNDYAKLNLVLKEQRQRNQHRRVIAYLNEPQPQLSTLHQVQKNNEDRETQRLNDILAHESAEAQAYQIARDQMTYIKDRNAWLEAQLANITFQINPLVRTFHWEDDVGGDLELNQKVPWWELSRLDRKDLVAALIFGTRISLVVGIVAVSLALIIGVPVGSFAGYYGGTFDVIVSRLLEIWESMPTFFMLLMVVAVTQSKSIFLVISVIGLFGWTTFSRYIRGEFFKQRNLAYVQACHSQGFDDSYIMFRHILPNAIPPLLTLLPFAIMDAITSEAGLSFLGLGEEGSCSWGVLMDEGRSAFPQESYLLWPPAILLTVLLVSIALIGDAMRDALDPKLHR